MDTPEFVAVVSDEVLDELESDAALEDFDREDLAPSVTYVQHTKPEVPEEEVATAPSTSAAATAPAASETGTKAAAAPTTTTDAGLDTDLDFGGPEDTAAKQS